MSFIKKACNVVFQSSKNEEIALPHKFIFVFIWYSGIPVGRYCQKSLAKRGGFGKNKKRREQPYRTKKLVHMS